MTKKLKNCNTFSTHFVTFTFVEWIFLFEIPNTFEMVYE